MNKDGFENFDEDIISSSRPLEHFHKLSEAPQKKNFNFLVVQKMNVEGPNMMHKYVVEPLQQVGQTAIESTKNAIIQLPSWFKWGASIILDKLSVAFHKTNQEKQPQTEQKQQLEQIQPEDDIDQIPVVFVVPKEILEGPIVERLKWIDRHKNNCQVFIPFEKPLKLKNFQNIHNSSSSSSSSDDFDCDVRHVSQEFKTEHTESELFPSTQSIKSKLFQSQKRFIMSQDDYKLLEQQNNQNLNSTQPQNIILYPFLGEFVPKDQMILDQSKQQELNQSTVTMINPNMEQIQIQQIQQTNENQFIPLQLNGLPFKNNQLELQKQDKVKEETEAEEVQEKQLEQLLEI